MTLLNNSDELIRITEKELGRKNQILEYALETTIYHSDNSDKYIQFLVVPFINRKVIWINPIEKGKGILYSQRVRVDCQGNNGYLTQMNQWMPGNLRLLSRGNSDFQKSR